MSAARRQPLAPFRSWKRAPPLETIVPKAALGFASYPPWVVAAAAVVIPALLAWFGFRATGEWQRSSRLLLDQRTSEVVTLMIMALNRDMRAVQSEVLPQVESLNVRGGVYDVSDEVTAAFARFPYPEAFFTWTPAAAGGELYVYTRSNRPPAWKKDSRGAPSSPTVILKNPSELRPLLDSLRHTALSGSQVLAMETRLNGELYQIVARARYGVPSGAGVESLAGFMVNLTWARQNYYSELLAQISNVLAANATVSMSIFDERGALVAASPPYAQLANSFPARAQRFPLLFFDPLLGTPIGSEITPTRYWTARAQPLSADSMLGAARNARRTLVLIAVTALAAGIALIFAAMSVRAAAQVATIKSEFVSAVTHELKTPLASIRLASETLVRGRYRSQEIIVEYSELLLNEVSRLTRSIDNLLAIARVQDLSGFYFFEPLDLVTLVEEALSRFDVQLREQEFKVHLDVPASLPPVHADRTAILQVLGNLLDNAIRYSGQRGSIGLTASSSGTRVTLCISDNGPGIPSEELPRVFEKFFRGKKKSASGSGLGLAIVRRILKDHGGAIRIRSLQGCGTTAELTLPVAAHEEKQ